MSICARSFCKRCGGQPAELHTEALVAMAPLGVGVSVCGRRLVRQPAGAQLAR